MTNAELVEMLCMASTPLREARRLHFAAYGILIPHIFMSDVLHRIGQCLGLGRFHGAEAHESEAKDILAALERGMAEGERETRNVIAISFTRDSELELFSGELQALMGPRTRAQLKGK